MFGQMGHLAEYTAAQVKIDELKGEGDTPNSAELSIIVNDIFDLYCGGINSEASATQCKARIRAFIQAQFV